MKSEMERRKFLKITAAGCAICAGTPPLLAAEPREKKAGLISPGCRGSRVSVAVLYMGTSHGLWPKPDLNFKAEMDFYNKKFAGLRHELQDVDFIVNDLVTSPEEVAAQVSIILIWMMSNVSSDLVI